MIKLPGVLLIITGITGCAAYQAKPLNMTSTMPHEVPHLVIDARRMPLPELASHRFDPSDGLDMTETAMLAVVNNPDLKLARDDAGIARAQAFAAGLLPDPQLSIGADFPTNGPSDLTSAYSFGLSYDVGALLLRSSVRKAARSAREKTDLNLLWQEWQVVGQARLLFVRDREMSALMGVLQENRALFAERLRHAEAAFQDGNAVMNTVSADATALQDVEKQVHELTREATRNRYALNLLLGLAPEVKLTLVGDGSFPAIDEAAIRVRLARLADFRPDLMALKAGYESEDQRLRQAILGQFPALNIGLTRGRDTSNIHTIGFGITLSLPVFDRNRGHVAIEEATRQRLYDEFQVRLNSAGSEIQRILADQKLFEEELRAAKAGVAALEKVAAHAGTAYGAGNIDETTYADLQGGLLRKRMEAISLEQGILEQRIGLLTLVGGELPVAEKTKGTGR